jgi:hypothetical protein
MHKKPTQNMSCSYGSIWWSDNIWKWSISNINHIILACEDSFKIHW